MIPESGVQQHKTRKHYGVRMLERLDRMPSTNSASLAVSAASNTQLRTQCHHSSLASGTELEERLCTRSIPGLLPTLYHLQFLLQVTHSYQLSITVVSLTSGTELERLYTCTCSTSLTLFAHSFHWKRRVRGYKLCVSLLTRVQLCNDVLNLALQFRWTSPQGRRQHVPQTLHTE